MSSIVTDPGVLITDFPVATVEIKERLEHGWITVEKLYCDKLTLAVNAYDEAEISYQLGDMIQPGDTSYNDYQPLDLLGHFVRVTCPQEDPLEDIVWIGVVIGTAKERAAVKEDGATNRLAGKMQAMRAVGLEYFLDRVQIDSAVVYREPEEDEDDFVKILRSIPFNGGRGVALDADTRTRANRAENVNEDGIQTFTGSGNAGELWTLSDVINYLTFYYTPVRRIAAEPPDEDTYEKAPVEFTLAAEDVLAGVTDGICPTLDPDGMTTFQILNKLLAPQRGFVWWLETEELSPGVPSARIRVESIATELITLPSLGTVPANRDQHTLDLNQERTVDDVIFAEHGSRIYQQVIVRGARMTSTCTLGATSGLSDGELIPDWKTEIEDEYKAAAGGTDKENDAFRKEERFYRVYTAFRLDPEWDHKSSDGGDAERNWTFPVLSDSGSVIESLPVNVEGLRLLNLTRLKRGWNYENTASIEETTPEGTEAEYAPFFAIVKVADGSESGGGQPDKYQFIDKMSKSDFGDESTPVSSGIKTSYYLLSQQNVPGILLRPNSNGAMNHAIALNHFVEAAGTTKQPEVAYDTLRVTCTMEADAYCDAKYPADADLPEDIPLQKLVLYVGKEYRLDFLAANTVVRLNNGEPVLTNGGILRDDRKHLADVARVAYEWYRLERFPITVKFRQLRNLFRLGMLITSIGSGTTQENVNTVVSMITYDFINGTTTIQTNDEDLDLVKVV